VSNFGPTHQPTVAKDAPKNSNPTEAKSKAARAPRHPPCSACTQCTHGYRVHQALGHEAKDFPSYVCSVMGCGEKGAHWPDQCPMLKEQQAQEQARVLAKRARASFERENKATTPAEKASLAAMVPKKFA
jgi:sRNA-binding protein